MRDQYEIFLSQTIFFRSFSIVEHTYTHIHICTHTHAPKSILFFTACQPLSTSSAPAKIS